MMTKRKDPRVYLEDIRNAIDRIGNYTESGKRNFLRQETVQDAVIRQLSIVGEAANRLSKHLRDRHPEIAWKDAVGMHNILIHDYADANIQRVWETVQDDLPPLKKAIESMLKDKAV